MRPAVTIRPHRLLWRTCILGLGCLLGACTAASAQGTVDPPAPHYPVESTHIQEHAMPQEEDRGTLQVSGQAQVSVPADKAIISFAVETEARSAQDAVRENAQRMDAVIAGLGGSGIEGMEIETFGYNLSPDYRYPSRENPGSREIASYRAQNNIRVTLPEVESAGAILDAATEAGANRVQSVQFEASNLQSARLQALAEAVNHARQEAEVMAQAMGVELGTILTVTGGANTPGPRIMARAFAAEAAQATTPIEAAGQVVSANVTITYRIREPGS